MKSIIDRMSQCSKENGWRYPRAMWDAGWPGGKVVFQVNCATTKAILP
jgi:hypothetical protein